MEAVLTYTPAEFFEERLMQCGYKSRTCQSNRSNIFFVEKDERVTLKQELRRLMRSMDFVSRHPSLNDKDNPECERFAELYQQLGMLWQFFGLQCRHWDGYRRNRSGTMVCRLCGIVKGAEEHWLLLPRKGDKSIGRKTVPTRKETFPHKRAAQVLTDSIRFHGVLLAVDVQNAYRSRLLNKNITIASDRIVRFEEGGIECVSDTHCLRIKLPHRDRKSGLPYSAFPSELPRKFLKQFPVLLEYDKQNRFVGVIIFKPRSAARKLRGKTIKRKR